MEARIDELTSWITTVSSNPIKIWCEDPEEHKGTGMLGKSYLTYRILLKQQGRDVVGIRHRYSEFEALQKSLFDRYSTFGILVPDLPPKKVIGSFVTKTESMFIKERTHGLSLFCEDIASNPFFRNDSAWKTFLNSNDSISKLKTDDSENVGENMLVSALQALEIPAKIYPLASRVTNYREEVVFVKSHVSQTIDKIKHSQEATRKLQTMNESLNVTLSSWSNNEKLAIKLLNGFPCESNESALLPYETTSEILKTTCDLLVNKHLAMDDVPDYDGVLTLALLYHELSRMESILQLLKMHDEIVNNIESLTNKLHKAEASKSPKALDSIVDIKNEINKQQQCLEIFYKGFIHITLPLVAKLRSITFRRVAKYLGSTIMTTHNLVKNASERFFNDLKIDFNEAIQTTNHTIDLFALKPLTPVVSNLTSPVTDDDESINFINIFQIALGRQTKLTSTRVTREDDSIVDLQEETFTTPPSVPPPLPPSNSEPFSSGGGVWDD